MINVNQITSQLARMPDQALQQYAQMHKNDPYTVSLALAESNRRKVLRTSAQGQQDMTPPPKVVDQDIAAMTSPMPEDVGIGALPAPNMQGMAEGGIVAFAGEGPSLVRGDVGAELDLARTKERIIQDTLRGPSGGLAYRRQQPESYAGLQAAMEQARQERELAEAAYQQANSQAPYFGGPTGNTSFSAPSTPPVTSPAPAVSTGVASSNADRGNYPGQGSTGTQAPAPAAPRASAPRAPVAATPADQTAQDYLAQLEGMRKKRGTVVDPYAADTRAINEKAEQGVKEGIAALKADQAADMAVMRKGQEGRINKREGEIEKSKDTNTGLAFLEAGLAMMQARGPGLAAIAQGAGIGVKQYAAGIDKIKSAQEKLDDARDRMEELRQNQESMNKSAIRAEEKDLRKTVLDGQRELRAGVVAATGVSDADFRTSVATKIASAELDKKLATTLEAARIAAGPGMERNKMLAQQYGGQDKVRKDYITLQTKVMADLSKNPNYALEQDPNKKTALYNNALRAALQNNPFLSSYAAGIGFNKAPESGAVRSLDED